LPQDLYSELLGIPPGPRPPDRYAILGVALYESDATVIHEAVLRQSAELKRWQLDPRPGRSLRVQEMLNEVNRAGVVLEDPKTRAEYDRRLAEQLGIQPPRREEPAPPQKRPEARPPTPPVPARTEAETREAGARKAATRLFDQAREAFTEALGQADEFDALARAKGGWASALAAADADLLGKNAAAEFAGGKQKATEAEALAAAGQARAATSLYTEATVALKNAYAAAVERTKEHQGPEPQIAVDLGRGIWMELVLIRSGTYEMGSGEDTSEQPAHQVTTRKPFYIGKYEITQEQWQAVMGSNPSRFKGPKNPVEEVSWASCQEFVRQLSEKTGRRLCLPSEAEWEYACRAGTTTRFSFGDGEAGLAEYAWYAGNSGSRARPVGLKEPNAWGLYDMHGNVWEWCEDVWHPSYEGAPADGSPWVEGGNQRFRVLRGGSWVSLRRGCRCSYRSWLAPTLGGSDNGCRVVLRDS